MTPISRKRGFSKSALSQALATQGIVYEHRRELGNPKENRPGFGGTREELESARAVYAFRHRGSCRRVCDLPPHRSHSAGRRPKGRPRRSQPFVPLFRAETSRFAAAPCGGGRRRTCSGVDAARRLSTGGRRPAARRCAGRSARARRVRCAWLSRSTTRTAG
ncbi:DUF488 domain-containing protein [Micromonospora sp. NBC_01412]